MLGLAEKPKPTQLEARGGCWFESGAVTVHLGVDKNFVAAGKAHPAFIVDGLADMVTKLKQAGYRVTEDEPLPGCDRRHVHDPFGNRIELIEPHAR
jgi:catechol 2,3-dioxygenase-like lactoylglutathione lyase family enzyme